LAYFSTFASDSIPLDTSTDVDSDSWLAINALTSLRAQIKSSFSVQKNIGDAYNAFFEVPAKQEGQKTILFERIKSEPINYESSGGILSFHNSSIKDKSHVT